MANYFLLIASELSWLPVAALRLVPNLAVRLCRVLPLFCPFIVLPEIEQVAKQKLLHCF